MLTSFPKGTILLSVSGCFCKTLKQQLLLILQKHLDFLSISPYFKPEVTYLKDELWGGGGHLFDVHPSLGASHHYWTITGPVH